MNIIKGQKMWTLKDEEMYLEETLRMHDKRRVGCNIKVNGISIFKTWLNTYKKRRWYLSGIDCLVPKVNQYLSKLEGAK